MRNDNNVCRRLYSQAATKKRLPGAEKGKFLTPFIISTPHLFRFVSRRDVIFFVHALISLRAFKLSRAIMKRFQVAYTRVVGSRIPLNYRRWEVIEHIRCFDDPQLKEQHCELEKWVKMLLGLRRHGWSF